MDPFTIYVLGSSAWSAAQAIPFLLMPRLVITLLQTSVRDPTELETYLCHALGLALLMISCLTFLLSGELPLQTSPSTEATPPSPYATPMLIVTTSHHIALLGLSYVRFNDTSQLSFGIGVVGSGLLAAVGIWCLIFGGTEDGKSRGSSWLFPDKKKRERKIERREERWARMKGQ